jgi:hypothetical protein
MESGEVKKLVITVIPTRARGSSSVVDTVGIG